MSTKTWHEVHDSRNNFPGAGSDRRVLVVASDGAGVAMSELSYAVDGGDLLDDFAKGHLSPGDRWAYIDELLQIQGNELTAIASLINSVRQHAPPALALTILANAKPSPPADDEVLTIPAYLRRGTD